MAKGVKVPVSMKSNANNPNKALKGIVDVEMKAKTQVYQVLSELSLLRQKVLMGNTGESVNVCLNALNKIRDEHAFSNWSVTKACSDTLDLMLSSLIGNIRDGRVSLSDIGEHESTVLIAYLDNNVTLNTQMRKIVVRALEEMVFSGKGTLNGSVEAYKRYLERNGYETMPW